MHQMENLHLLAVEDVAVLEVVMFEQLHGSDNQSTNYQTLILWNFSPEQIFQQSSFESSEHSTVETFLSQVEIVEQIVCAKKFSNIT